MNERVRELVVASAASAARQGLAITTCPYAAQGTPSQREKARLWVGAYLAARPPVHVAYDDEGDDEEGDPQLGRARFEPAETVDPVTLREQRERERRNQRKRRTVRRAVEPDGEVD